MQSSAEWVRKNFTQITDISDSEINAACIPPPDSIYTQVDGITSLVIHHSATETGNAEVFRALHRAVNGWVDIGYHFVIGNGSLSEDGEIERGRPMWAVGAHARGHNTDTLGICLVGNFSLTYPTVKQRISLAALLRELLSGYALSESAILLHRDVPGCITECPGDNISNEWISESLQQSRLT